MKLDQSFEVEAPLEHVWSALLDIQRVAPCLPGASVQGLGDDGSYEGAFKVKIGPTTAAYAGRLSFENVDEATHTATMRANGSDRRGQGGARATIVSTLEGDGARTRVRVSTEYHITGRLARFGRGGMIEDIAERLLRQFADNLQARLKEDGPATEGPNDSRASRTEVQAPESLDAGSLVASVAWERSRSSPLVPALIMGLLVLLAIRRRRRA